MYILLNKTTNETTKIDYVPNLTNLLVDGNDLVLISLYSNTIKFPFLEECDGIKSWSCTEMQLPVEMVTQYCDVKL